MKAKSIIVLVKADDDKIYQAYISTENQSFLEGFLTQISKSGKIELLSDPIENIDIIKPVKNEIKGRNSYKSR